LICLSVSHPASQAGNLAYQCYKYRHAALSSTLVLLRTAGPSKRDMPEFLKAYEQFGGLVVNWRIFGSSGHKTKPQNTSTLEAYTACIPDTTIAQNIYVKSIVNVNHTAGTVSPSCVAPLWGLKVRVWPPT
jgi:hypothetical protein